MGRAIIKVNIGDCVSPVFEIGSVSISSTSTHS